MQLRISKKSEVPVRQQITEQIVFLIATGKLRPGEALPSVRGLGRQLEIHPNTVSDAYQDLVRRGWLAGQRGRRLLVRSSEKIAPKANLETLDDLINNTIREARERGFTLLALRERVRHRLEAQPPDHILVVEEEPELCRLIGEEIRSNLGWPVRNCTPGDLAANQSLLVGALVVAPQYLIATVERLVSKDRPAVPIAFSAADALAEHVRKLRNPSVIAVVSVSDALLRTARSLFAPAAMLGHSLCELKLPLEDRKALRGMDLLFCDSLAICTVKHPRALHYRVIAPESLEAIASTMNSYQE